jgi:hypothetical protein
MVVPDSMSQLRFVLLLSSLVSGVLGASASCGGKVVVDDDENGGASSGAGASSSGAGASSSGAGGASSGVGGASTGVGGASNGGGPGSTGSGAGGEGPCNSCAEFVDTAFPQGQPSLCTTNGPPSSVELWLDLRDCICAGPCPQCDDSLCDGNVPSDTCQVCLDDTGAILAHCGAEASACLNDI